MELENFKEQLKQELFNGKNVRILGTNNEPKFVSKDIGELLEIKNIRDAVKDYDADERCVVLTDTPSGKQELVCLTESGLFTLQPLLLIFLLKHNS